MMPVQGTLSHKEEKAIEELQMRVKNFLTQTIRAEEFLFYYRFLKARDFDVDRAEKMLRKHIIWRKVNQIDTILEDFTPIEFFLKYPLPSVLGFDKDGAIVRYSAAGSFNPIDIMKCMTANYYMKHWMWFAEKSLELLRKENERTGKKGYQAVMIFNLDKLTFANATSRTTIDMFLHFLSVYQDNYPERMKSAYIINAPSFFVVVFSILKTVISSAMLRKIHIFGSSGWKEKFLEIIDADVLPAFLGGNRTDPDGNQLCKTFINHGGKIPEYYFLSDEDRYLKDTTHVETIILPPKEKEEIHMEVKDLGSLLQWEFFVKGKDIGFGVFFEASKYKVTEIIPTQKYNTSDGKEKDSYKCRSTGKYIVIFDNTYSWMSSKEVRYRLTLLNPKP